MQVIIIITYCATLILWSHGKPIAWDMTIPDTFAQSYITATAANDGVAVDKAASSKTNINTRLSHIPRFSPFAFKTGGSGNSEAVKLVQEIGKTITTINFEPLETQYMFQCISITIDRNFSAP